MQGVYIHIPFCMQKCRYCDFVSYCGQEDIHAEYIEALGREMAQYRKTKADTVFIGGGTPTILVPALLDRLLSLIRDNFQLAENTEFSVEANPKTLSPEKLRILKNGGVNRLSIGVQSFCDEELRVLGRIHSAADAYNTVWMAKNAGFENVNLDLMSALPGQTRKRFQLTLEQAVKLEPAHISCYSLILEEGTPLAADYARGCFQIPDEDEDRDIYEYACAFLAEQGYMQYEISNFAKPGFSCRHNLKYWECQEYIGLGAAAHSFDGTSRRKNTFVLAEYLEGRGIGQIEAVLNREDKISEFMIMGLRKADGISEHDFFRRFGVELDAVYGKEIRKFLGGKFLEWQCGRIFLTRKGISVSNSILCEFILK